MFFSIGKIKRAVFIIIFSILSTNRQVNSQKTPENNIYKNLTGSNPQYIKYGDPKPLSACKFQLDNGDLIDLSYLGNLPDPKYL